ncbi:hypothetical protein CEQ90_02255 [Lewinellaceae bacterium SD302]|nr:hypothetical protein CEQ90_02255 [Lewinellaceae bacterium SD302]
MYERPEDLWQAAWQLLTRANKDRKHAYRTATVSTVTPSGYPSARTVVMRNANRENFTLRLYTDRRSHKVAQLEKTPRLHWLFWDPKKQIQFSGVGEVVFWPPDQARELFIQLPKHGRKAYATVIGPGEPAREKTDGLPPNWSVLELEETDYAAENFLVVETRLFKVDLLYLDRECGNQRLNAQRSGDDWKLNWMVP